MDVTELCNPNSGTARPAFHRTIGSKIRHAVIEHHGRRHRVLVERIVLGIEVMNV